MPTNSGERVFTSWKDIASFFGKGVRTVQRWESKFGLPISRPTAAKNVVLATESELRDWIRRSSSKLAGDDGSVVVNNGDHSNGDGLADLSRRLKRLEDDTARLARIVATFSERIEELSAQVPSGMMKSSSTIVRNSSLKPISPTRK